MGNSKSTLENSETINVNHPYFGDIHVVTHQGQKYMKIRMLTDGQNSIANWEKLQQLVKGIDPEPLLLPADHKFEKQGMCGTTGVLHILYENHPVVLKDEIQNRRQTSQSFQENQIWYLLHVLISSAAEFHKRNHKVGDIRPDNIFINESGQIKIANICSWPRDELNYYKSFNDKEQTYLAPQEIVELQNDVSAPISDPIKGQSFSIGLTLLDAICLVDSSKLYNFKNFSFDKNKFYGFLSKLQKERFSDFLKDIVNELLAFDPIVRKSPEQIYQKILPYEYFIKNLLPFSPIVVTPNHTTAIINKNIATQMNNMYRQSAYSNNSNAINPHGGFTQSVYERTTTPIVTTQNFLPSNYVGNTRVTIPTNNIIQYNTPPSDIRMINSVKAQNTVSYTPTTYTTSNQNYTISGKTIANQGTKSKQQLMDQIDKQILMSKKMFP